MTYSQFVTRLQSRGWRDAGRECLTSPARPGTPEMMDREHVRQLVERRRGGAA